MKSYKTLTSEGTPEEIVSSAIADLQELADEIEQWKSGMEGTNLENSEKYSMLSEAYDLLSSVQEPSVDEWPHSDAKVTYSIMVPKRTKRGPSRAVRASNATGMVGAVIDFYQSLDDAEDHTDIIDELQEIADLEIELPGMYG